MRDVTTSLISVIGNINKKGMAGLIILGLLVIAAVLAPVIAPYDPRQTGTVDDILCEPDGRHWLGTDEVGP